MKPDAEALMRLLAEKTTRGQGEVVEVLASRDHGTVVLDIPSDDADGTPTRITLHVGEAVLMTALRASDDLGVDVWGERLSATEALARLMSVHLEESLDTRGPSPTGWWTYDGGMFEPRAPWED